MSDTIIRVENLGKKYLIGQQQEGKTRYVALRDVIANGVKSFVKNIQSPKLSRNNKQEFWALNNVSFEVKQGEVLGIIGRNGAGKSTLLKILSRITEPTVGRVSLKGRVASLLEVGTGFHPELTGRENIYLNGSILGMAQAEIKRKFDEIVAFAEVEKFLDTPVKRYSSGMYVRLAFAVAAHLEPEILVVDEVLAVGDAAFQKKCLGKMGEVATKEGRTVLFVSHNMATIQSLCNRSVLLNQGIVAIQGVTSKVIEQYLNNDISVTNENTISLVNHPNRKSKNQIILQKAEILSDGLHSTYLKMGGNLKITVYFKSKKEITNMRFGISIEDYMGQRVVAFSPSFQAPNLINFSLFQGIISCQIPCLRLLPGIYYISLILGNGSSDLDRLDQAIQFVIESADVFGTGYAPEMGHGIFYEEAKWIINSL